MKGVSIRIGKWGLDWMGEMKIRESVTTLERSRIAPYQGRDKLRWESSGVSKEAGFLLSQK
jgi:hypothetical protein